MAGAKFELDEGRNIALIGGSGSLGAGSPKQTNANWDQLKTYQRMPLGETVGDPHPSRGAISPFYGTYVYATTIWVALSCLLAHRDLTLFIGYLRHCPLYLKPYKGGFRNICELWRQFRRKG
jgi:hypothetical protein